MSLNIHDRTPRYFRMPRIAATESVVSESQRWLNAATGLDDAARVLADLPSRVEMLAARCQELPSLLATIQEAGGLLEWSA